MHRHLARPIFSILLIAALAGCFKPTPEEAVKDARLSAELAALGLLISPADSPPQVIVQGQRSVEDDEPVTDTALWHLGSLTKAFTATLAARLVDSGQIAWHTTLADVFPELVYPLADTRLRDVSLRELLNQTAGFATDETLVPSWERFRYSEQPLPQQRREFLQEYLALDHDGEPGTFRYANGHYIVAGTMLEAATGESFEAMLNEYVMQPLGIISYIFGPPREGAFMYGHRVDDDGQWQVLPPTLEWDNPRFIAPSGTLTMHLADLNRFLVAHRERSPLFLSPEAWNALHNPPEGSEYAMGWRRVDTAAMFMPQLAEKVGQTTLWHGGSNGYWVAGMFLFPESGFAIAAAANAGSQNATRAAQGAVQGALIGLFDLDPPRRPDRGPSISTAMMDIAIEQGPEAAVAEYYTLLESREGDFNFGPGEIMYVPNKLRELGRCEDAIPLYQLEAERFPQHGQGDYMTAYCFAELGDMEQARHHYGISIAKQPQFFVDDELEAQIGWTE